MSEELKIETKSKIEVLEKVEPALVIKEVYARDSKIAKAEAKRGFKTVTEGKRTFRVDLDGKDFYGPYGRLKRRHNIPKPGVVINGRPLIGRQELKYDEYQNIMSMISARVMHELQQKLGMADVTKVMDLATGATSGTDLF